MKNKFPIKLICSFFILLISTTAISQDIIIPEFLVNDDQVGAGQFNSSISVDDSGNFVITWQDDRSGYGGWDIYAQRYSNTGVAIDSNFKVNDDPENERQFYPSIAMNYNGNFVITWDDNRNNNWDIYAQRYSNTGATIDTNFRVNDDLESESQFQSSASIDNNGNFVITWCENRNGNEDIYAQRYSYTGEAIDTNFKVNDDQGSEYQRTPSIAMDDNGNFVITWCDNRNGNRDIYAQRFSNTGTVIGINFKVNDDYGNDDQMAPSISMHSNGYFVISWDDHRNGDWDIYAQCYSYAGTIINTNFKVNDDQGSEYQRYPSISMNKRGFVITWQVLRDTNQDVYCQVYSIYGTALESNFRITSDIGNTTQSATDVSLWNNQIYCTWIDRPTSNSRTDIRATVLKFDSLVIVDDEVYANFGTDIKSGNLPLTLQFSDSSSDNVNTWLWDFENDGIVDSYEQNPIWIYYDSDSFSVKLIVSSVLYSDTLIKHNYITTYFDSIPNLFSVKDIPNDQGGWVKVKFARSVYDTDSLVLAKTLSPEMYSIEIDDGSGWMATASTVAYGKSIYSVLVPTTKDSTTENNGIINFRVIAGMAEGNFVSNVMIGYSKDNLQPSIPQDLAGNITSDQFIKLYWKPVPDKDFKYYQIYRSNDEALFELIASTIDTVYIDNTVIANNSYYYSVKAVDFTGNESDFSNTTNISITDINEENSLPTQYYLSQNYPNPFNPQTTIKYGLLNQSQVKITIFDILGHKIKEVVNETQNQGHHQVIWDGKNNIGHVVSTGIYYYKLETENYSSMKKMLFIK